MIHPKLTLLTIAGIGVLLNLGAVAPAFADQNDNHDNNNAARHQRDHNWNQGDQANWSGRRRVNGNDANHSNNDATRFHRGDRQNAHNSNFNNGAAGFHRAAHENGKMTRFQHRNKSIHSNGRYNHGAFDHKSGMDRNHSDQNGQHVQRPDHSNNGDR